MIDARARWESQPKTLYAMAPSKSTSPVQAHDLVLFDTEPGTLEHAKTVSQKHNEARLVYRLELVGIVVPQQSQFRDFRPQAAPAGD